ncbi:MAG: ABC transporter permease [Phycisphaeraceae bacterium]|nr:ABC transporter permease [Phycisphaeraceae bacterium]
MSSESSVVSVRSSRQTPLMELLSLPGLLADLWRYRELLGQFTRRDIEVRHKGTNLGIAWTIINPLLTLGVYTIVFTQIFPSKWEKLGAASTTWDFVLYFFCGWVVYGVFAETVTRAPAMVLDRPNLVRKVVFPLEVLAPSGLLASLFFGAIGLVILLVGAGLAAGVLSPMILLFPVVLVPLCMLTLGVTWGVAALGVFIRDTKQVVPVVMQLLFFATPIFYPASSLERPGLEIFHAVILANPLTTIVEASRSTLLRGEQPDWLALGVVTAIGLVTMQVGYAAFMRCKRGFSDVI